MFRQGQHHRIQVRQSRDRLRVFQREVVAWTALSALGEARQWGALEDAVLLRRLPGFELPDERDPNERWLAHPRDGVAKRRSAGWRITQCDAERRCVHG